MRKGEATRERVLHQAAQLFNEQGYAGASLAAVMQATGLQKGGIYNHFESKEALAVEAFDYAVDLISQHYAEAFKAAPHAIDRLHAVIDVFSRLATNPPIPGGCPIMNTAVESDDTNQVLRAHARKAMDDWRGMIGRIIAKGVARGEVRAGVVPDEIATLVIAMLEGALMLSRLYADPIHMQRAVNYVRQYVDATLRA